MKKLNENETQKEKDLRGNKGRPTKKVQHNWGL